MTTLTERLRELEARVKREGHTLATAKIGLALAQDLHALLVECGAILERTREMQIEDEIDRIVCPTLTKLKQAGIV